MINDHPDGLNRSSPHDDTPQPPISSKAINIVDTVQTSVERRWLRLH